MAQRDPKYDAERRAELVAAQKIATSVSAYAGDQLALVVADFDCVLERDLPEHQTDEELGRCYHAGMLDLLVALAEYARESQV